MHGLWLRGVPGRMLHLQSAGVLMSERTRVAWAVAVRRLLVALAPFAAAGLLACGSSLPPAITEGGVQVSDLALERETIASGTTRLFELPAGRR